MSISSYDFSYDEMSVISKKQFDVHMKLYKDYINKVNEITQDLNSSAGRKESNATYSKYRGLKKGETFSIDSVILHELYFQNIGTEKTEIHTQTKKAIEHCYKSMEMFKKDFVACATSARGWCLLCYEQRTKSFRNILLDAHDYGNIAFAYPVIALDMYEHAYFTDYGSDKSAYIENFCKCIDWDVIEDRINYINAIHHNDYNENHKENYKEPITIKN